MYPAGITFPSLQEYTEVINQSNGQPYTPLFIKLRGIYAMWCSKSDSIMNIYKLSLKLRATWVLFARIFSWEFLELFHM